MKTENNEDLRSIYEKLQELYAGSSVSKPVLRHFRLGSKWAMAEDDTHVSLALRMGTELSEAEYVEILQPYYGMTADHAADFLTAQRDPAYRLPAAAVLNLLSKPLNTPEELQKRGILRTPGLAFPYDVAGKKTGLVGFGPFAKQLSAGAAEFHVYDMRTEEQILRSPQAGLFRKVSASSGSRMVLHLGMDAADCAESLRDLDILIASGSSIVGGSYRNILDAAHQASVRGLYGPSNEMCPDALFDMGFNYLFSTSVRDRAEYERVSTSGQPYVEFDYMDLYELRQA